MEEGLELVAGNDVVLAADVEIDVNVGGAWLDVPDEVLPWGDGDSSSSESELSDEDEPPAVEGLLSGESGLSGPSPPSLPGPTAPRPASCRFACVAKILMGFGRRS